MSGSLRLRYQITDIISDGAEDLYLLTAIGDAPAGMEQLARSGDEMPAGLSGGDIVRVVAVGSDRSWLGGLIKRSDHKLRIVREDHD